MSKDLKKWFGLLTYAFTAVWVATLVIAIFLFMLFREDLSSSSITDAGEEALTETRIFLFASLIVGAFGLFCAIKFAKFLKTSNIRGGQYLIGGFGVLLVIALLTGTIFGGNIATNIFVNVKNSDIGTLSIICLILFTIFPVFTYLAFLQATKPTEERSAVGGASSVRLSSLILMIVAIVLSPMLLTCLNAYQKFDDPTILNVISAIIYAGSVGYFLFTLFKSAKEVYVTDTPEESEPTYEPISEEMSKTLTDTGKAYLYMWCAIALSAAALFYFFSSPGTFASFMVYLFFAVGLAAIGYGIYITNTLRKLLALRFIKWNWIFTAAFGVLILTSLLCYNTPFGGSMSLGDYVKDVDTVRVGETVRVFDISRLLSFIALILFIAFPVLTFVGTFKLTQLIPTMKKGRTGALVMMISSIIFSPFLLCGINSNVYNNASFINILALISYGVGLYLFLQPWSKCEIIRTAKQDSHLSDMSEEPLNPVYPQYPNQYGAPAQNGQPLQNGAPVQPQYPNAQQPTQPQQPGAYSQYPQQPGAYPQYPQQPGAYPQYPQQPGAYPQQPQQPGAYPQYPQQPGAYPQYPQQPGAYPQYPQQPGAYPQYPQQPGAYPQYPQQPGAYTQYPQQPGAYTQYPQQPGAPVYPQYYGQPMDGDQQPQTDKQTAAMIPPADTTQTAPQMNVVGEGQPTPEGGEPTQPATNPANYGQRIDFNDGYDNNDNSFDDDDEEPRRFNPKYIYLAIIVIAVAIIAIFSFRSCGNSKEQEQQLAAQEAAQEQATKEKEDSLRRAQEEQQRLQAEEAALIEQHRQDSIRIAQAKIAAAMPKPSMFFDGEWMKRVDQIRKKLTSLGYKKINSNNFALKDGDKTLVTVKLNFTEFEGEYDPEYEDYVGAGYNYGISIIFANQKDADSVYKTFKNPNDGGWVQIDKRGKTIDISEYGD